VNDLADLLVRSIPILIGGGTVQFAIFLLKRRTDVKLADASMGQTRAEAGSVVVTSAERSVAMADALRDDAISRAALLLADLDIQLERIRRLHARLAEADGELAELRAQVAALRSEMHEMRQSRPRAGGHD
jgi:hypothetical protein